MILVPTSGYHMIVVQTFGYAMIAIWIFGYDTCSILKYWAILEKGAQHTSWGRSPSDPNLFEYDLNNYNALKWDSEISNMPMVCLTVPFNRCHTGMWASEAMFDGRLRESCNTHCWCPWHEWDRWSGWHGSSGCAWQTRVVSSTWEMRLV
jgi:hypothetical protein